MINMSRIPSANYVKFFDSRNAAHIAWLQAVLDKLERYEPDALQANGELRPVWMGSGQSILPLLAVIRKGESGAAGYRALNKGKADDTPGGLKELPQMTLAQIAEAQLRGEMFAVGAYQIIPTTLAGLRFELNLPGSTVFDPTTQDKLAIQLISGRKRRDLAAWVTGRSNDMAAAQTDLAKEWASIPLPSGRGFYDGDRAGNMATAKLEEVRAALKLAYNSIRS